MNKSLVVLFLVALITIFGCKKDKSDGTPTLDNKIIINEIFKASMTGYNSGMSGKSLAKSVESTYPINYSVESTTQGPEGGNIHVVGSITGSMTLDDQTNAFLGGTLLLGFTETLNDYGVMSNGQKFILNGAPYLTLTGTFTLLAGGTTFGTASSLHYAGGIRATGTGYDQTINIDINMIINSNGTGGSVSGLIGGEQVNYTF
jgi:hypothetical protein